jgi:hypothetical protein
MTTRWRKRESSAMALEASRDLFLTRRRISRELYPLWTFTPEIKA